VRRQLRLSRGRALGLLPFVVASSASAAPSNWSGIDETVVEKIALEAGRHPHGLLFEMDQGDLPLFLFLCAGIIGGAILGYYFRMLFVEQVGRPSNHEPRRAPER
jgi:ABC-type cobalt transport system substrate-binding protein